MTIEAGGGGRWQRLQPRERALIVIFGLIAVLAVVYLLFISGGGKTPEALPTFTPRPRSPVPSASPTSAQTTPPQTSEVFEGKDPFRPLVGPAGGIGGTPAPTSSPPSSGGPSGAQHVTLVDISGSGSNRTATVEVDSQTYTVKEGDTFAGSYKVKSLTASCGTFMFGDETFTLCVGQEVIK
jgi:hypothetical protein